MSCFIWMKVLTLGFCLIAACAADEPTRSALAADDECMYGSCELNALQLRSEALSSAEEAAGTQRSTSKLRMKSSYVGGNWSSDQQKFIYTEASHRDFLITWAGEGATMNVTSTEALKWAGPLTLLQVIQSCPSGSLAKTLAAARERGSFKLHLVGVGGGLEPMMEWDRFLLGPLSTRQLLVVEAFGLPKTPFLGMEVSLSFNEFEDSKHVPRQGPFSQGYKESFVYGQYDKVAEEVPDLVLAMNPGFAHYPQSWWKTLHHLQSNGVTVLSTGYGNSMKTVYEYIPSLVKLEEDDNRLQLPEARLKSTRTVEFFMSPGGATMLLEGKADVADYIDKEGRIAYSKSVFPDQNGNAIGPFVQLCQAANSTSLMDTAVSEVSGVCSDLNGTFFMGQEAGYSVKFSNKNVFQYCDHAPPHSNCDANGVVALLEPTGAAKPLTVVQQDSGVSGVNLEVPRSLFQETLRKALHCTLERRLDLVPCVEARLLDGPQSEYDNRVGMFENMESFFLHSVPKCAGGHPMWMPAETGME